MLVIQRDEEVSDVPVEFFVADVDLFFHRGFWFGSLLNFMHHTLNGASQK